MGSAPGPGGGPAVEPVEDAVERYVDWLARDLRRRSARRPPGGARLRERRRRGRRAGGLRRRARHSTSALIGAEPDGRNINAAVGSTHLDAARRGGARPAGADCGIAFDGDADRCLAVDADAAGP